MEPEDLRKQFGIDQSAAAENMALLRKLAKDMVSVLLNVFSKLPRESRGMVGDVIGTWVGIMTDKVCYVPLLRQMGEALSPRRTWWTPSPR